MRPPTASPPPRRGAAAATLAALALGGALFATGCSTPPPEDRDPNVAAGKLYADAREDMSAGAFDRAIKTLQRVEGLGAGTVLGQQAQLDIAYMQWKSADREQALATIDRFVRLNPSSPALDYALYLRGLIHFNDDLGLFGGLTGQDMSERDQRASRDSFQAFRELAERFPQSRYAADASQRMAYITNALADHEVHVARYYFRRGAFVAAANRARQAVVEFDGAPAVEEALALMVRSYERLGLTVLRDDAERVLRKNYPQTRWLAEGAENAPRGPRPWWQFW
jgi:outer membrane protein assembly factor BamD